MIIKVRIIKIRIAESRIIEVRIVKAQIILVEFFVFRECLVTKQRVQWLFLCYLVI
jgi:hypothetical protein